MVLVRPLHSPKCSSLPLALDLTLRLSHTCPVQLFCLLFCCNEGLGASACESIAGNASFNSVNGSVNSSPNSSNASPNDSRRKPWALFGSIRQA